MLSACERRSEDASKQPLPEQPQPVDNEQLEPEVVDKEQPEPTIDNSAQPSVTPNDCVGCSAADNLDPRRIDTFVEAACHDNDYDLALDEFLKLAHSGHADERIRAMFAGWLYIAGEREQARERLRNLADKPDAALEVALWRGLIAQTEGDCKAAQKHTKQALALLGGDAGQTARPTIWIDFPRAMATDARALVNFVHGLVMQRCSSKSPLSSYKAALGLDPGFAPAHTLIGDLYAKKGEANQAAKAWTAAIAAQPDHADAYIKLGVLRESQCRFEEALELLDRGWQLNPFDDGQAPYSLCFAYTRAGRYEDAARACQRYATAHPHEDDASDLYAMGNLLLVIPEGPAMNVHEMDEANCPTPP